MGNEAIGQWGWYRALVPTGRGIETWENKGKGIQIGEIGNDTIGNGSCWN